MLDPADGSTNDLTPAGAVALDASDPLASFRSRFFRDDSELNRIYLNGNSLGRLPVASVSLVDDVVRRQWGQHLIRSWDEGWFELPRRAGNLIAKIVGASSDEVVLGDATSVLLFKAALAALRARPGRTTILTDDLNFPSDIQVLRSAARLTSPEHQVVVIPSDGVYGPVQGLEDALVGSRAEEVALVSLSHVAYNSGWCWDLQATTKMAQKAGALMLWDLCHSVGVVPIRLSDSGVDLAVGCTYKYLNGGPGSPAFLYVNSLRTELENPVMGWFGLANPMGFSSETEPAEGASRFLTGTPPIISAALVEPGVDLVLEAGVERLRDKSNLLTRRFVALVDKELAHLGFSVRTPRESQFRGSHVALGHTDALAVGQALINEAQVITDYRPPDLLRFGFAPLYIGFREVDDTVRRIKGVIDSGGIGRWRGVRPVVS